MLSVRAGAGDVTPASRLPSSRPPEMYPRVPVNWTAKGPADALAASAGPPTWWPTPSHPGASPPARASMHGGTVPQSPVPRLRATGGRLDHRWLPISTATRPHWGHQDQSTTDRQR